MDIGRVFDSKVVMLLLAGVAALVVSRIIKRGRVEGEQAGALENILWVGGMLITLATLIYAVSRGCRVDVPVKDEHKLEKFEKEPSGCGGGGHKIKQFKK